MAKFVSISSATITKAQVPEPTPAPEIEALASPVAPEPFLQWPGSVVDTLPVSDLIDDVMDEFNKLAGCVQSMQEQLTAADEKHVGQLVSMRDDMLTFYQTCDERMTKEAKERASALIGLEKRYLNETLKLAEAVRDDLDGAHAVVSRQAVFIVTSLVITVANVAYTIWIATH